MIIYGSRSTHISTNPIFSKCQNCGTTNNISLSIYQKYAHIFWIPFFPLGKETISQCEHCKNALRENEMPSEMKTEVWNLKKQAKTPIWTFALLGWLAGVILFSVVVGKNHEANRAEYYTKPALGDTYTYKTEEGQYSLMKVTRITKDSIFFFLNTMEISKSYKTNRIDKDENYEKIEDGYSKTEIAAMVKSGIITDVKR
jgi:hypothetical protein